MVIIDRVLDKDRQLEPHTVFQKPATKSDVENSQQSRWREIVVVGRV